MLARLPLVALGVVLPLVFAFADEPRRQNRPPAQCPIPSLVVRHYLADFSELQKIPLIDNPEKFVRPGDVLVVVASQADQGGASVWGVITGSSPHAMIVMKKDGALGHLNSPAFIANFVPELRAGWSYVILRPKFTPELQAKFKTQQDFEDKMNAYLLQLEAAGFQYDPLMQTDLLSPEYLKSLRNKLEKNCLKKGDVRPLYCSELPATVGAVLDIPQPKGKTIADLFDEAILFVKAGARPEEFEQKLITAVDEIIDLYLKDFRERAEGLRTAIQFRQAEAKNPRSRFQIDLATIDRDKRALRDLEAQIRLFEQSRSLTKQVVLGKAFPERNKPVPEVVKTLLKSRVIRPQDFLSEAQSSGYEAVGLYADKIPKECFAPVLQLAVDPNSPTTH